MNVYIRQFVIELRRNGLWFAFKKALAFLYLRALARPPKFGLLTHDPLISVIVVSYNSQEDLPACLSSIKQQSYPKLEIIVVENGTSDTRGLVESIVPEARWLRAPGNVGFAAGNNVGLEASRGELIALVNPDARLDDECLFELLCAFRLDGNVAVAAPKTRFWTRFVDVHLESDAAFSISSAELESQLNYKKLFIRQGRVDGASIESRVEDRRDGVAKHAVVLRLPMDESCVTLRAIGSSAIKTFTTAVGASVHQPSEGGIPLVLCLRSQDHPGAGWVINNAGTGLRREGPFDIGFGEEDDFRYDTRGKVAAFCGCVALIRRAALVGRPIFRPEFFAYYEDSELSHHCSSLGYRVHYSPRAIAYHKHSVSSSEGSPLWTTLVQRSRLIYEFYRGTKGAKEQLASFLGKTDRYSAVPSGLAETLKTYDAMIGQHEAGGRTIGLYNSYWNTMGGGEAHALGLTLATARPEDEIFLISESDFDIDELGRRFGYDLERCRKLVISTMTREFTARFDIFVNSTFRSNLGSLAKQSFYIVSFPHQEIRKAMLKDYVFLHNSRFTQSWAERLWGPNRGLVVCPTFSVAVPAPSVYAKKEKLALSIGRITNRGHGKNQHSIIEAFRATAGDPDYADWRLCLVGGFDHRDARDATYLARITQMAEGDPRIELLPNCPRAMVNDLLANSAIYIHAAGLGQPEDKPEYHEHFGIAPLEACLFGAWPVVYAKGGPADLVKDLAAGDTYRDFDEFVVVLRSAMQKAAAINHEAVAASARAFRAGNDTRFQSYLAETAKRT
ncbi:glycosyltransferase [Bosea sp. UNC402CLCol]|uniref:glycosyltransferase n=1 Tax=Bosea sp. UNC402CLCol TaxID=1510531 RepID=UPI00056F6D30|nr:glycosyltransferase [Bosea sp. UNC402CLCol]